MWVLQGSKLGRSLLGKPFTFDLLFVGIGSGFMLQKTTFAIKRSPTPRY